ncbi:MAG: hypothetical protein LBU43_11540, partial [Candidatus Accumulibacter sp.]|nr:hypothetical protein [Accumulibacter sp.]
FKSQTGFVYPQSFVSRSLDEGKNTRLGGLSLDLAWLKTSHPVVARLEWNYQRQEKSSERHIYLGLEARF